MFLRAALSCVRHVNDVFISQRGKIIVLWNRGCFYKVNDKVSNKNTIDVIMISSLLTLNTFYA